jgi:hypothetical protein
VFDYRSSRHRHEHIRNDSEGLENQIQATKSVAEQHGIDPDDEYNRHHHQRKKPRRIDGHPETAANLCLVEHYRNEFFAVLDAQINAIKANLEAVTNILQPGVTLLQPPYIGPVDNTEWYGFLLCFLNRCDRMRTPWRLN